MNVVGRIRDRIEANRNPVAFAKRLGVDIRGEVRSYGMSRGMLGSEPRLVGAEEHVELRRIYGHPSDGTD